MAQVRARLLAVLFKSIFIIAVAYLVTLAGMYFGQRKFIFPAPLYTATPAEAGKPEFQEIHVTTIDGLTLRGWYLPARDPSLPVVVHFHGNGSALGIRLFATEGQEKDGYGVLIVGYRGFSGNPGEPTEEGLYMDSRAFLDWLKAQGQTNIVLQGESLGTGVAVQMAAERPAKALVLEMPYSSVPDAAASHYPYFPVHWLIKDQFNTLQKIGNIHIPLLIIMGEKDSVIPVELGKAVFAAANDPKVAVWLPEADHNVHAYGAGPIISNFLNGLFKPAAKPE